jgi:hypothetical protein
MLALMNFLKLYCAFSWLNVGNSNWISNMEEEEEVEKSLLISRQKGVAKLLLECCYNITAAASVAEC